MKTILEICKRILVPIIIFAWVFSGWPSITLEIGKTTLQFPQPPRFAYAATTTEPFTTVGTTSWEVPAGVTSIYIKAFGAGGGGGGGGTNAGAIGGLGGNGHFVKTQNYTVTPGTVLSVLVGGGGTGGASNGSCLQSAGGGGGGYSGVHITNSYIIIAGGGGGGGSGGDSSADDGSNGGSGGNNTISNGQDGQPSGSGGGAEGKGGKGNAGGAGGSGVSAGGDGSAGAQYRGGIGGQNGTGCTGPGGTLGGAAGGQAQGSQSGGGGGGGAGLYGGGGGEAGINTTAETQGGGGGGGSSMALGSSTTTSSIYATDPDYVADKVNGGARGTGGADTPGSNGGDGLVVIAYQEPVVSAAPTVATDDATGITPLSATLRGTISDTGGSNSNTVGFAWGTDSTLRTVIATTTTSGSFGAESFAQTVSGLIANRTYYFRAYAINDTGTGYGTTIKSFVATDNTTPTGRRFRIFEGFKILIQAGKLLIHQ